MTAEPSAAWRRFVEEVQGGAKAPFTEHWARFQDAYRHWPRDSGPPIAWWPTAATRDRTNLLDFQKELGLESYPELHRFSVVERERFWSRVLERLQIVFDKPPARILDLARGVKQPSWLPGAELSITKSCFTAPVSKTAIVYGREEGGGLETITYGALEKEVNRFASGLRARGFEPGDAIALYMPMTPECVIAYLGTVRAGCRVVSVADSFSAEELRGRLVIANARAVVTVARYRRAGRDIELYSKVRDAIEAIDDSVVAIVIDAEALEGDDFRWEDVLADDAILVHVADPYHVTNVLFSSGTTGTPKAIPWTQLTPIKAGMDAHFHQDVHPEDVVCWPTNIGWMMGPWLVYASFLNGATMALYEGAPGGSGFTEFVREASVSVLGVVPSIVRSWRASESVTAGAWTSVRLFTSTGEASSAEEYLWLMSRADYRAPVIEYLGGTEIGGGHLTGTLLQPASPATFTTPALGIDVVILDDDGRVVPEGAMGELFLRPPALGLSQELLNGDHDAVYYDGCPTGPDGEVLRRHGDQIARLARGYFKAHGRADDTMNLGGIKVSSIELERVINGHAWVHESAAVAIQPRGEGVDHLVVYVVLEREGAAPTREDLRRELGKRIARELNPLFKVHDVVVVDELPRTASNKIMRRELRAAYAAREV